MRQIAIAVVTVLSVVFLLAVLGLGFLASRLRVDSNFHGMLAFIAGATALGIHIRSGSGLDFLAVVLLIAALGLGFMVSGGGIEPGLHLWAAIAAVATSAVAQIRGIVGQAR
jgi:hypothetical protein